jgi:hypothetical protein
LDIAGYCTDLEPVCHPDQVAAAPLQPAQSLPGGELPRRIGPGSRGVFCPRYDYDVTFNWLVYPNVAMHGPTNRPATVPFPAEGSAPLPGDLRRPCARAGGKHDIGRVGQQFSHYGSKEYPSARRFTMTTAVAIDCQPVHDSFGQWRADQEALDAQIADSVAALAAYQSHLDAWQHKLAEEREELRQHRAALERDHTLAESHDEQCDGLQRELNEAQQKITSLTTALLTRTEELRELDRQRVQADHQLIEARAREKELFAALEAERNRSPANGRQPNQPPSQPRGQIQRGEQSPAAQNASPNGQASSGQTTNGRPQAASTTTANPVLGSVMEQFGKLRQQRTLDRQNNPKYGNQP